MAAGYAAFGLARADGGVRSKSYGSISYRRIDPIEFTGTANSGWAANPGELTLAICIVPHASEVIKMQL